MARHGDASEAELGLTRRRGRHSNDIAGGGESNCGRLKAANGREGGDEARWPHFKQFT